MVAQSINCDQLRLERLLSDDLGPQEIDETHRHLESCESCRFELESMAGDESLWRETPRLLRADESDPELPVGNDGQTRPFELARGATVAPAISGVLERLSESENPAMLGKLGDYDILEVIGCGGMGVVLKGYDRDLNRFVAVKALAPQYASNAAARKRFGREARAAAAVVHPHVVSIHCVAERESLPYFVMQYVPGQSLQERIDADAPMALQDVLRIGMQAAQGLAAAHAQGLIHRDIKPANILLENGVERVLLSDFGLARSADDASMTQSGVIAGTPQFMSPEQARGETIDSRSDLFSLGSVLYAMCTGHSPFRAETTMGVLNRIVHDPPRDIRDINPDTPDWLKEIINTLLEKKPADRVFSAEDVATLLEAWLAHLQRPTELKPPRMPIDYASKPAAQPPEKPPVKPPVVLHPMRRCTRRQLVVAGGMLAAMIALLTIVIMLEWSKGRLTIVTDRALPIEISKGDRIYKSFTVTPEKNSVKIAAGEYVIKVASEFDHLEVTPSAVTIKRGSALVLRVTNKPRRQAQVMGSAGEYGMEAGGLGRPIGLPGPPHIPLGGPAGLGSSEMGSEMGTGMGTGMGAGMGDTGLRASGLGARSGLPRGLQTGGSGLGSSGQNTSGLGALNSGQRASGMSGLGSPARGMGSRPQMGAGANAPNQIGSSAGLANPNLGGNSTAGNVSKPPWAKPESMHVALSIIDDDTKRTLSNYKVGYGVVEPGKETHWFEQVSGKNGVELMQKSQIFEFAVTPHVDPMKYWLRVTAPGYVPQVVEEGPLARIANSRGRKSVLVVRMRRGPSVKARVVTPNDEPVANARVFLVRLHDPMQHLGDDGAVMERVAYSIPSLTSTRTDEDGVFEMTGADHHADRVAVVTQSNGLFLLPLPLARPEVLPMRLPASGKLRMVFEQADKAVGEYVHVRRINEGDKLWHDISTTIERKIPKSGKVELTGLAPGNYEVSRMQAVSAPGVTRYIRLDLIRAEIKGEAVASLTFSRAGNAKLKGSVKGLEEYGLVAGIVKLQRADDMRPQDYIEATAAATVDEQGRFEFDSLMPGRYVWSFGGYPPEDDRSNYFFVKGPSYRLEGEVSVFDKQDQPFVIKLPRKYKPAADAYGSSDVPASRRLESVIASLRVRLIADKKNQFAPLITAKRIRFSIRTAIETVQAELYEEESAEREVSYFKDVVKPKLLQIAKDGQWPEGVKLEPVYGGADKRGIAYDGLALRLEIRTPEAEFPAYALHIATIKFGQ